MVPRSNLNGDVNQQLLKPSSWNLNYSKDTILFVSQLYYCMYRITLFGEKTWELFMISYLLATMGLSLFLIWVKTFAGRNLGNPLLNIWWFWMLSPFFARKNHQTAKLAIVQLASTRIYKKKKTAQQKTAKNAGVMILSIHPNRTWSSRESYREP